MRLRDSTLVLDSGDPAPDVAELAGLDYDRVELRNFGPSEQMPDAVVADAFSHRLVEIYRALDHQVRLRYTPFASLGAGTRGRTLNVFPGAPVPLDKGSNQRAFHLTWHLNRRKIATDLLLTTSSRSALPRLAELLTAIAPEVHTYRNDKPMLPAARRLRRESERLVQITRGSLRKPPDLFIDRLTTRAARDGKRKLAQLVRTGRYSAVIINFAWMSGLLDTARAAAPRGVTWICDTHDVQFVRNTSATQRLWVDADAERQAEIASLQKYDYVLAISESDAARLREHLPHEKVVLVPSGFDYAHQPVPDTPAQPPYSFGFIGRSMDANVQALELLIKSWWPAIVSAAPQSRLLIAGTLCNDSAARRLVDGKLNVQMLGYVPTLADFYRRIDIALNPLVVQGGLNFKSVEAIAAGRLLITTEMGSRCLGANPPVIVVRSPGELSTLVSGLNANPGELHKGRIAGQRWYGRHFSEETAYAALRELLV